MSIDAPGAQRFNFADGSDTFNYIDTYIEYFTEVILKYENVIPETKNRQHKELQQHKQLQVIFSTTDVPHKYELHDKYATIITFHYPHKFACQFIKEITPPPPWLG